MEYTSHCGSLCMGVWQRCGTARMHNHHPSRVPASFMSKASSDTTALGFCPSKGESGGGRSAQRFTMPDGRTARVGLLKRRKRKRAHVRWCWRVCVSLASPDSNTNPYTHPGVGGSGCRAQHNITTPHSLFSSVSSMSARASLPSSVRELQRHGMQSQSGERWTRERGRERSGISREFHSPRTLSSGRRCAL